MDSNRRNKKMMSNGDMLYQAFKQASEQKERENFNAFMIGLESGFIDDLNKVYASGDMEHYNKLVINIKNQFGARIFRNSEGKHKISFM